MKWDDMNWAASSKFALYSPCDAIELMLQFNWLILYTPLVAAAAMGTVW